MTIAPLLNSNIESDIALESQTFVKRSHAITGMVLTLVFAALIVAIELRLSTKLHHSFARIHH